MEKEISEMVVKGKSVTEANVWVMKEKNVSMKVKRNLRNSKLLSMLTHVSEIWTWKRVQQSRVCDAEDTKRGM